MSMEHLKRSMERIERRMRPEPPASRLIVIWDTEQDADTKEREAVARGDKVIRVMFVDPRCEPQPETLRPLPLS